MSTAQEQFTDFAQRGQQTLINTVKDWTDTAAGYARTVAGAQPELPTAGDVVSNVFDFAEQLLRGQRELAANLVAAGTEVAEATRKAAEQATQAATAAVDRVIARTGATG
jgi:hypothetical protein